MEDDIQPAVGLLLMVMPADEEDEDALGVLLASARLLLLETIATNKTVFLTTDKRRYMVKESVGDVIVDVRIGKRFVSQYLFNDPLKKRDWITTKAKLSAFFHDGRRTLGVMFACSVLRSRLRTQEVLRPKQESFADSDQFRYLAISERD